jgi:hypothetical protein
LGLTKYEKFWELTIESMRKEEICYVKKEKLKHDKNNMKVLDYVEHYLF